MRKLTIPVLLLAFAGVVFAAEPQTIELKDGGKVVVEKDGSMAHVDPTGKRIKMRDGHVMETKDGNKVIMKNNAIWKTLAEKGTLHPSH